MRDGNAPNMARWLERGHAPPDRVGDRPLVADRREPGRHPARLERGHPRVPLGREGDGHADDLLGAAGLRGARAAARDRDRPAARRRREPRQPALRRGRPRDPHGQPHRGREEVEPRATGPSSRTATTSRGRSSSSSTRSRSSSSPPARSKRRDVRPRGHRGLMYAFMRAAMCVVVRDLIVYGVLTDMMKGRPAMYATFSSYDEVAHHSGLERPDTLEALRKLDQQFGRIDRARRYAPRPYVIVVLSDHGQTQGATFKQRNGYGLEDLVEPLARRRLGHGDRRRRRERGQRRQRDRRGDGRQEEAEEGEERRQRRERRRPRLRQPRAHLPHGRAPPADEGGDRRAPSRSCSTRSAATRTSAGCSCAPASTARSRSAAPARATSRAAGSTARIRWRRSRRTRRGTCCARTASRTSRTSWSAASTTRISSRAARSRS